MTSWETPSTAASSLAWSAGEFGRDVHLIDGHTVKYRPVGKRSGDRGPVRCGDKMEAAPQIEYVALAPVIRWKTLFMGNSDQLAKLFQRSADRLKFRGPGEEIRPGKNLDDEWVLLRGDSWLRNGRIWRSCRRRSGHSWHCRQARAGRRQRFSHRGQNLAMAFSYDVAIQWPLTRRFRDKALEAIERLQQERREHRGHRNTTVAHLVEHALHSVRVVGQFLHAGYAGATLHGVQVAEQAVDKRAVAGRRLEVEQIALDLLENFARLFKKDGL